MNVHPWLKATLAVAALFAVPAQAAERKPYSEADYACSAKETWSFGGQISKAVRDKLKGAPVGKVAAVDAFVTGYAVKLAGKTPETQALGEYFMYRAFFELNLIHFADRGFGAMLNTAPNPATQGIKLAALSCMNRIHHLHPALGIAYNSAWALGPLQLNRLTFDQRRTLWEAMATMAGRKLYVSGRNAQIEGELKVLQGSGAYETFVRSIQAQTLEQDPVAISWTERFVHTPNLPEYLRAQLDGAHLNLARLYYHAGNYVKSVQEFKKVTMQSNFFSRALTDAAWAHMMLKNYSDAAGSAYNLMVGDLRKTFAPDAPVIIAMALFENCHYKEAQETLAYFKKNYDKTYHWLYDWYHQNKTTPTSLYPIVASFLKTHQGVPEQLASEWIRSPVFIAEQQELNLAFEEEDAAKELVSAAEKASKGEYQKLRSTFKGLVANFVAKLPETKKGIVDKINSELAIRNNTMIASLVESFETAQLIEVEIYNQAGEDMVRKVARGGSAKDAAKPSQAKKADDGPPALDWGRFPASDDEESETWGDELGAIKTDVTNICRKK